ncbi:MAG: hypothetical protein ACI4EH_12580 [Oliverpabstia sp.]
MLKWYKKLYIGDNAKKKAKATIKKLNQGRLVLSVYVITLASNEKNLLDFFPASHLKQKVLRSSCPMIVGLADGYEEALQLVQKIIEETYQCQGDTDVRTYLKNRLEEDDGAGEK